MMNTRFSTLLLSTCVAVVSAMIGGSCSKTPDPIPLSSGNLADSLRQGGFVIFIRHAATNPIPDDGRRDLTDCATQRNLSNRGRDQARTIGQSFQRQQIPVGRVFTSPYCRCSETATLAFGADKPVANMDLISHNHPGVQPDRLAEALRAMLSEAPDPGTNTVLVGHLFNFTQATNLSLAEGEAAVFEPLGNSRFRLVSRGLFN